MTTDMSTPLERVRRFLELGVMLGKGRRDVTMPTVRFVGALDALHEMKKQAPTPALLRSSAEWFDNPNASPPMVVDVADYGRITPGFLLRLVADALERTTGEQPCP